MSSTAAQVRALRRLTPARPWVLDAALATVVVLTGLLTAGTADLRADGYSEPDGAAVALILGSTVPYYLRRRFPLLVLVVATSALAALMLQGYPPGALPFTVLLGVYTVGVERPAHEAAVGSVFLAGLLVAVAVVGAPGFGPAELAASAAAYGGALALGHSLRSRGERIEALARQREEAALRAATGERLRIAQEMHDVVAHSLGVIAVQAGVGMHVIEDDPAEARRSLEHISRTSRASLAEIRGLLGLVRDTDGAPAYTPAPGLSDLARVADDVTRAGLQVDVSVVGDTAGVPAGVGLAAYRIVQEALTNALRHAHAHRAAVRLTSTARLLLVEVCDDGLGARGHHTGGHGLVGMQERVSVYGGSLDTGPAPDGGFRVAARLPYDAGPVP